MPLSTPSAFVLEFVLDMLVIALATWAERAGLLGLWGAWVSPLMRVVMVGAAVAIFVRLSTMVVRGIQADRKDEAKRQRYYDAKQRRLARKRQPR
jgi:hypothetical protein